MSSTGSTSADARAADAVLEGVLADLTAEGDQLRAAVASLADADWTRSTPAQGWDVATTISHLLWTDEAAVLACGAADPRQPEGQAGWDALVSSALVDIDSFVDNAAAAIAVAPPAELLARWDSARTALVQALRGHPRENKLPWFGPPMSPTSMATARYMETWAHGLDVYDALEVRPEPTDRIRHVAHIGVRTRGFSYVNNGLEPPSTEVRVELVAPSGQVWTWGPENTDQRVTGPAIDFCTLVTQRVHRDDTDLETHGADAEHWLRIAQAFAGPPGAGRPAIGGAR